MNKRLLNLTDYGISKKRYAELKSFCEQYPDWKNELRYNVDTVKSKVITDMPLSPHNNSDATGNLAVMRSEMQHKCGIIESSMLEACNGNKLMYDALIKSICYEIPFYDIDTAFCNRATFSDYRRKFFGILNRKKA